MLTVFPQLLWSCRTSTACPRIIAGRNRRCHTAAAWSPPWIGDAQLRHGELSGVRHASAHGDGGYNASMEVVALDLQGSLLATWQPATSLLF